MLVQLGWEDSMFVHFIVVKSQFLLRLELYLGLVCFILRACLSLVFHITMCAVGLCYCITVCFVSSHGHWVFHLGTCHTFILCTLPCGCCTGVVLMFPWFLYWRRINRSNSSNLCWNCISRLLILYVVHQSVDQSHPQLVAVGSSVKFRSGSGYLGWLV